MRHLCRGGDTVWEMADIPLNIPEDRIGVVIGTARGPYAALPAAMFAYDVTPSLVRDVMEYAGYGDRLPERTILAMLRDRYAQGLNHSDGIVPVTSQNMRSRLLIPDDNVIEIPKCHTGVQKIERASLDASRALYNMIKQQMNTE